MPKRKAVKKSARKAVKRVAKKTATKRRALARRTPVTKAVTSTALVPTAGLAVAEAVPQDRMIQLGHVRFTKAESSIIIRAVVEQNVLVLPTGPPYLPHYEYTRWLNEAFGPTGWNLSLLGDIKFNQEEKTVYGRYCLFIRQVPVSEALGQQEYHSNNPRQSYGDAIEAAAGSGLRRCCKRLGIGLELWDRRWAARFRREHCILVSVIAKRWNRDQKKMISQPAEWWRRKDDEPFPEEKVASNPAAYARKPKGDDTRPITTDQRTRLWTVAGKAGRTKTEVKMFLTVAYNLDTSHDVQRKDYDAIITKLEAPGRLVEPNSDGVVDGEVVERAPGEEG